MRIKSFNILTFVLTTFVCCSGNVLAQVSSFSEKEITFTSGDATLSGTLLMPDVNKPAPAIIFLHGSGPMTRLGFRDYAEEYARMGFVTLAYDKRGAGKSTGVFMNPLRELAEDAKAAIRFLKSQKEVDAEKIGFWGISQAGWVTPIAAAETGDIEFMIIISGGGASPYESEIHSWKNEFKKEGLSGHQQKDAIDVIYSYFQYLRTGEGYNEHVAKIDSIRNGHWRSLAILPEEARAEFAGILERILPAPEERHNFLMLATYDPVEHIRQLNSQVLLMMGDKDMDHPTELAVKGWREGMRQAGNDGLTVVMFPGAGHGIRMREGYTGEGRAPFADGYREIMSGWLWRNFIDTDK